MPDEIPVVPAQQSRESPHVSTWTRIESAIAVSSAAALHALARIAGIEVAFSESKARTYRSRDSVVAASLDGAHAEFLFNLQREDSTHTDDKVKQLLALSSSLAAVLLAFARDVRPQWMIVVILTLLVCAVFLCLSVLGVRTEQFPTLESPTLADGDNSWAHDLVAAGNANAAAHAFRVDRYRAASRYFRLALLLTPIAAVFTVARPDPSERLETSITGVSRSVDRIRGAVDSLRIQGVVVRPVGDIVVTPAPGSVWQSGGASPVRRGTSKENGRSKSPPADSGR